MYQQSLILSCGIWRDRRLRLNYTDTLTANRALTHLESLNLLRPPSSVAGRACMTLVEIDTPHTTPKVTPETLERRKAAVQARGRRTDPAALLSTLTLARDLVRLPRSLVEYVVIHELLHLRAPHHNRAYRLLLDRYVPDWQERELDLARWTLVLIDDAT